MSDKKIIAVLGATGQQGGSVVRYLLEDGTFTVRAITRNTSSPAAENLKSKGAEVVQADLNDVESLKQAFAGASGIFAVTNFFEMYFTNGFNGPAAQEVEETHGKNIAVAAKEDKELEVLIWSTLDGSDRTGFVVPHLESKHNVELYLQEVGVPSVALYTSFYYENISNPLFQLLKANADGTFITAVPAPLDVPMPCYSVQDTGGWALPIFKSPAKYFNKVPGKVGKVDAIGEYITPLDFADTLGKVTGKKVSPLVITKEQFGEPPFKNSVDPEIWLNQCVFVYEKTPMSLRDVAASHAIFKGSTYEEFCERDKTMQAALGC